MRTTIRLDENLLKDAKQLAARTGKTLTAVLEEALRDLLRRQQVAERPAKITLPTFGGNGLLPGVDLDDSAALQDIMDGGR
jgi:hypothetical protein